MDYEIILRPTARKQLDSLSSIDFQQVSKVIAKFKENPRPTKVKKLVGSDFFRVRIGNLRVVYHIDDERHQITIVRIARRNEETYKNLN